MAKFLLSKLQKYLQKQKLIQSHLTEPSLQPIVPQKTVLSQLLQKIKQIVDFINLCVKNFGMLNNRQKINWVIAVSFLVGVLVKVIREYYDSWSDWGDSHPKGSSNKIEGNQGQRKNFGKLPSRQQMLKKNPSLISLKQYQSHSDSGSKSAAQSSQKQFFSKKPNKDLKQFCTDIETESHEQNMQTKRDKFFFTLIGSYQKSSKENKEGQADNKFIKEDYEYSCSYEVDPAEQPQGEARKQDQEAREGKERREVKYAKGDMEKIGAFGKRVEVQ